jgi:hypothetical protein
MGVFALLKEMKLRFLTSKDIDSMNEETVKHVKS